MIEVQISEDALRDLNDGFLFDEAQEGGLGDYFTASLRADIEGLKATGGVHRKVYRNYHRLISRVFPHGVFYTREENLIIVWAVVDLRREPDWIRDKLR